MIYRFIAGETYFPPRDSEKSINPSTAQLTNILFSWSLNFISETLRTSFLQAREQGKILPIFLRVDKFYFNFSDKSFDSQSILENFYNDLVG